MADGGDSICDCLRTSDACFEALLNSSITGMTPFIAILIANGVPRWHNG